MPNFSVEDFKKAADKICNKKPGRLVSHEVKGYWLDLLFKSNSGKQTWPVSIHYDEERGEWLKSLSQNSPQIEIIFNKIMSLLEK